MKQDDNRLGREVGTFKRRFEAVMGLGRALVALGRPEVAAAIYGAEAERAERELREMRAGRGW